MNTNQTQQTVSTEGRREPELTPLVYTVNETALVLKTSTKTVRRLIKRGFFAPSKALRKLLIPRTQVDAFLKSTCGQPKAVL